MIMKKYNVITLCGSARFKDAFQKAQIDLTLEGNIVISLGVFNEDLNNIDETKIEMLGDMHMRKIDMCNEIFVINVGWYIGSSTKSEIEYAKSIGKPVRYLEEVQHCEI